MTLKPSVRQILLGKKKLWDLDAIFTDAWYSLHPSAARISSATIDTGVSQLTDVSGNNYTATQGTGTNQPAYQATGFNGFPSLSFDGTNDLLSFSIPQKYNQVVIAVVDTTNLQAETRTFMFCNFTSSQPLLLLSGSSNYRPAIFTNAFTAIQDLTIQDRAIFFWQIGGNGTGFNRTDVNASRLISSAHALSPISTFTSIGRNGGQDPNMRLSELVVLDNPSQDTIDRVHGIFAHRWWRLANLAVPLPSTHPYFLNPPTR